MTGRDGAPSRALSRKQGRRPLHAEASGKARRSVAQTGAGRLQCRDVSRPVCVHSNITMQMFTSRTSKWSHDSERLLCRCSVQFTERNCSVV